MTGFSPRNLKYMRKFSMSKPIGFAQYQLAKAISQEIKSNLPTIKQLETELKKILILSKLMRSHL